MSATPDSPDEVDENDSDDLAEVVPQQGVLLIKLDAVVDSMAGSGYRAIWEWNGRCYFDCEGIIDSYASRDEAIEHFDWVIHTSGNWIISGELAEEMLDRIEVYGLAEEKKPFGVKVNGKRWRVVSKNGTEFGVWTQRGK